MTTPACPACTLEDVLAHSAHWECSTCGHEWPKEEAPEAPRVVKEPYLGKFMLLLAHLLLLVVLWLVVNTLALLVQSSVA